jgi:hypothetical protein
MAGKDTRLDPTLKKRRNNSRQGDVLNVDAVNVLKLDEQQREQNMARASAMQNNSLQGVSWT